MNSIKKGHNFERKVVKILEKSFPAYKFWRVPLSGASATIEKTEQLKGDILGEHKETKLPFPISIECKNHKDNSTDAIMFGDKKLYDFLEQAMIKENWMLFIHIPYKGEILLTTLQTFKHLEIGFEGCEIKKLIDPSSPVIVFDYKNKKIVGARVYD
jgi:Holliday junction resolvase